MYLFLRHDRHLLLRRGNVPSLRVIRSDRTGPVCGAVATHLGPAMDVHIGYGVLGQTLAPVLPTSLCGVWRAAREEDCGLVRLSYGRLHRVRHHARLGTLGPRA